MRKVLIIALSLMSFEIYSIVVAKATDGQGCINILNACMKTCADRSEGDTCFDNCRLGYKFCDNTSVPGGTSAAAGKRILKGGAGDIQTIPGTTTATGAGAAPATTIGATKPASTPPAHVQTPVTQGAGAPQSIQQQRNMRER